MIRARQCGHCERSEAISRQSRLGGDCFLASLLAIAQERALMAAPYRLTLFENYRFVLYAPFYAAHAIGAYADEGLAVELLPSPGAGRAEAALAAGEADVLWMGPIRVMKHHDEDPGSPL